jgi:hypothetical protein
MGLHRISKGSFVGGACEQVKPDKMRLEVEDSVNYWQWGVRGQPWLLVLIAKVTKLNDFFTTLHRPSETSAGLRHLLNAAIQ